MDNQCINEFNGLVMELASQLSKICPTSVISNNISVIKQMIKSHPTKIMDIFVMYVLKYKQQIDAGNETFFLENSYLSESKNDPDAMKQIFTFKNIWSTLHSDNKEVVIQYMQLLCQMALLYVNNLSKKI